MKVAKGIKANQNMVAMLRRALENLILLYTDKAHFIYELLQNAEDCGANSICFRLYDDRLEVLHNGRAFTEADLQSICDIGSSSKREDLNKIGEFGIGFKSVFGICDTVRIFSNPTSIDRKNGCKPFAVEIRDFVDIYDLDYEKKDNGYSTIFEFPYCVGESFSGFGTIEQLRITLAERLTSLGIESLLFMKNLESIDYVIECSNFKNTNGSHSLSKRVINGRCTEIKEIEPEEQKKKGGIKNADKFSYLLFSKQIPGLPDGKTIDIAFYIKRDRKGKITFEEAKNPYIFVYFPTETESKLKFIVQGPFRMTPNRSSVPSDNEDNIRFAKITAELFREAAIELRDVWLMDVSFMDILPLERNDFYHAPLFKDVYYETRRMYSEECLIPCADGKYGRADNVKIGRGSELVKVLDQERLSELIGDGLECHWVDSSITENTHEDVYNFLTKGLNVDVLRPENLSHLFSENADFLKDQSDEWIYSFYDMYSNVAGAFSKTKCNQNMLTAPIIKTSEGDFEAAYRGENGNYTPNVYLPIGRKIEGVTYVDKELFEARKDFFIDIVGLQKPDEYASFIEAFKASADEDEIDEDDNIEIVKQIIKFYRYDEYRKDIETIARNCLYLKCYKDDGEDDEIYCNPYRVEMYLPIDESGGCIEQYFKGVYEPYYLDIDFYKDNEINPVDLLAFNINDSIVAGQNNISGILPTSYPGRDPSWYSSDDFRWHLRLEKLREAFNYITDNPEDVSSMCKSAYIFNFMYANAQHLHGDVYVNGSRHKNYIGIDNDMVALIKGNQVFRYELRDNNWSRKWLYDSQGELHAVEEISKTELNTDIYGPIRSNSAFYEILGFKVTEDDESYAANEYLNKLSDAVRDAVLEKELKRRFGMDISLVDVKNYCDGNTASIASKNYESHNMEFPNANINNWEILKEHATKELVFANPIGYRIAARRVRNSTNSSTIKSYIRNMYRYEFSSKYACQMCHEPCDNPAVCQIKDHPKYELKQMHLCLCPNCMQEYKALKQMGISDDILSDVSSMEDDDIKDNNPVVVSIDNRELWFTQVHIAEIREILHQSEDDLYGGERDEEHNEDTSVNFDVTSDKIDLSNTNTLIAKAYQRKQAIDEVKEYFSHKGLRVVDWRVYENGNLWIVGGEELNKEMSQWEREGIIFDFTKRGGKASWYNPAWWLRKDNLLDALIKSLPENIDDLIIEDNKSVGFNSEGMQGEIIDNSYSEKSRAALQLIKMIYCNGDVNDINDMLDESLCCAINNSEEKSRMIYEELNDILDTITEQEKQILTLRFGLDSGCPHTFEQIINELNLTGKKIIEIESKALRKLRHPSRTYHIRRILSNIREM